VQGRNWGEVQGVWTLPTNILKVKQLLSFLNGKMIIVQYPSKKNVGLSPKFFSVMALGLKFGNLNKNLFINPLI